MPPCIQCGQEAHWQAYRNGHLLPGYIVCKHCKPAPWTSGSKQRKGIYFRPIREKN